MHENYTSFTIINVPFKIVLSLLHQCNALSGKYWMCSNCKKTDLILNIAGSNGNKLSRPQRAPETQQQRRHNRQDVNTCTGPWLCSHYKRRCLVKFDCCEKYWPCHRCHNSQNDCGRNKLKSRDIVMIKCTFCQKEQRVCVPFYEMGSTSPRCDHWVASHFFTLKKAKPTLVRRQLILSMNSILSLVLICRRRSIVIVNFLLYCERTCQPSATLILKP